MNNVMNPVALLAANGMSLSERSKEALAMVVMGMVMVFLVLAIIMIVLMIMERVFATKASADEAKKTETVPVSRVETPVAPVAVSAKDDGAVIAAITAAISAMLAEENGGSYRGGFRVVSFKRSGHSTPWNSLK